MERELTREQREHLEALIRTSFRIVGRLEMELERIRREKRAHENFLRDYGQPVLLGGEPPQASTAPMAREDDGSDWLGCDGLTNETLREICDACAFGEEENLRTAMGIKLIKCMGMEFEVK